MGQFTDSSQPVLIARLVLAAIFILGGMEKLGRWRAFSGVLRAYRLLPPWALEPAALAMPVVEGASAILLLVRPPVGAPLTMAWLVAITLAVVINILRGNTSIACGCGSAELDQRLTWGLVARNCGLLLLTLCAGLPLPMRAPSPLALFTIGMASVCGIAAHDAVSRMMSLSQKLGKLRR